MSKSNKIRKEIKDIREKLEKLEDTLSELEEDVVGEEEGEEEGKGEGEGEEGVEEGRSKVKGSKNKEDIKEIVASLDNIASMLEELNTPEAIKFAFEIDKISDELEGKSASAIKYDEDEDYMKDHFKGGVIEKDEDEDYLKEFNKDVSNEVKKTYDKSKEASLPYSII